ncbi:alpha/beta fold hydrolase [Halorussus litoreus]|uniref:alpha/beta fold hydrolase n=1 Tax=Halorussus litoreus TaxID=1710536 RepID=UPI000E24B62D|nr:alpha/beta hydrolase [Halorussus litoreus]
MTNAPTNVATTTAGESASSTDDASTATLVDAPVRTARTSAGARLSYATYGDPDGLPLVFLHGTPGSRLLGGLLDDAAAREGVQVISPDRPGHGRSVLPADFDLSAAGDLVATLADDVGADEVAVAGFSAGGAYALAAAATAPERVRSVDLVSSAVPPRFVDDQPAVTQLLGRLARTTPRLLSLGFRLQAALAGVLPQGTVAAQYTAESSPVEVSEAVERLVATDFQESFARSEDGNGAVTDFGFLSTPWNVAVESASCPVRIWHGDADANAPVEGARGLAAALPDTELRTFDDHGHLETLLAAQGRVVEAVARRES